MPEISKRAVAMPESPIRKLMPFAMKAKSEGKKIYHLNIGQPDIQTPDVVLERMKNIERTIIEYSNSEGFESYRDKLSSYYKSVGIGAEAADIMVTAGGSEALVFTMMTCFNPGDEVIIPEPYYANYSGFSTMSGIKVVPITAKINDGFALPAISEFENLITSNTKGIVICNPGNPTGYVYSKEEMDALAELVAKHDLYLISDEVYREFCYDGTQPKSAFNLEGIANNTIIIDSVSKRYSMCGARIGAMITRNSGIIEMAMKFAQARLSPPTFGQIAAEAALDTPDSYFEDVISEYTDRRNYLVDELNKIPGVFCPKPKGAFYCMAELPIDNADKFCQWLLESYHQDNETIMLAPGSGFYITQGQGEKQVRIAYVLNKEDLARAVSILKGALEKYPGVLIESSSEMLSE